MNGAIKKIGSLALSMLGISIGWFAVGAYRSHLTYYGELEKNSIDMASDLQKLCSSKNRFEFDGCLVYSRGVAAAADSISHSYPSFNLKCDLKTITVAQLVDTFGRWNVAHPAEANNLSADSVILKILRDSPTCGRENDF